MSQFYVGLPAGEIGPFVETITGDFGSITGANLTIFANNALNVSGSTVAFYNSGTISTLHLSDNLNNGNTFLGEGCGNSADLSNSFNNTCLGYLCAGSGTALQNCVAIGSAALIRCLAGQYNVAIGASAGLGYTNNESSNIVIRNSGVGGENSTIRIGIQGGGLGQQNRCFIAGVVGVTVANQQYVTINSATGQLGVTDTFEGNYTQTTVSYQVLITDSIIGVTSTAAPRTITMPNVGMQKPQIWIIKDESGAAGVNNITVSGNGVNIDEASTYVISANYGSVTLYWNGTKFFVI